MYTGGVINPHIREETLRRPVFYSVGFHILLVLLFTLGTYLLPGPEVLKLGLGPGGGQRGDFVSVGLSADIGGGAGMYKPPITPRPESAPPKTESESKVAQPPPKPEANVFEKKTSKAQKQPPEAAPRQKPEKKEPSKPEVRPGLIPREADPGKGPAGGGSGTGGGFGGGRGVSIGSGSGEGNIDSWYIRRVEQRVGQNWLQTTLGTLERPVDAIATFIVQADGRIQNIQFEKRSGIRSVDLAVQRAIQASNPLPPLPSEFRGRAVKFQAIFEYPPR